MYQVQIPNSGKKHIVNLKEHTCNYTRFEEYDSPCIHAIVAYQHEVEDPYKLFAEEYTVSMYRKTYNHFLQPFSIENLQSKPRVLLYHLSLKNSVVGLQQSEFERVLRSAKRKSVQSAKEWAIISGSVGLH